MVLQADNTHLEVEKKLEKYRQELADAERAKKGAVKDEDELADDEPKKKPPKQKLILCTTQTKYRVIKKACRRLDFKMDPDENADWDLYWADTGLQPQRIQKM